MSTVFTFLSSFAKSFAVDDSEVEKQVRVRSKYLPLGADSIHMMLLKKKEHVVISFRLKKGDRSVAFSDKGTVFNDAYGTFDDSFRSLLDMINWQVVPYYWRDNAIIEIKRFDMEMTIANETKVF